MKCDIDPSDKWCWCVVSHRTIPDTQISYNISVNFDTCARTVPASVLVKPGGVRIVDVCDTGIVGISAIGRLQYLKLS